MVRKPGRLAVLIGAEKADIEQPGHGFVGGEHQANIRVLFVAHELISAAVIQGDGFTLQAGFRERLLFDGEQNGLACLAGLRERHGRRDDGVHALGDVLHAVQHAQLHAGTPQLPVAPVGVETVVQDIRTGLAQLLESWPAHVMIGQDKPIR